MIKWIFSLITLFLISTAISVVIIFNTDPYQSKLVTKIGFLFFSWLSLTSLFLLFRFIYSYFSKKYSPEINIIYLRRCALIALGTVGLVFFSAIHVLNILSASSFVITLILIELFFLYRKLRY